MKRMRMISIPLLCGLCWIFIALHWGCEIKNPVEDFDLLLNIEVQKSFYSGPIFGSSETTPIVRERFIPDRTLAKRSSPACGFVDRLLMSDTLIANLGIIPWEVYQAFSAMTGAGRMISTFLSGTATNLADNRATIDYYFSWIPDSADLTNEADWIANLILEANETDTVDEDSDFDGVTDENTFLEYLHDSSILEESLIFYIKGEGDPVLDLHIPECSLYFPPTAHVKELINPGDLTDYKLQDLQNSDVHGRVTNEGDSTVTFDCYISIMIPGYVSGQPAPEDKIGTVTILPGETVDLATTTFLLPDARPKIEAAVTALFEGGQVEANLLCISSAPIVIQARDMELVATATVGVSP